jgi:putative Holliday junction resolvase
VRILALDYGTARTGCAVSDPSGTLVTPLDVIEPSDPAAAARLAAELEAELIVVGLPVSLDGSEGEQAASTREFCRAVSDRTELPVETYDERLTTRMAAASRRSGAAAAEDSLAAAHLLEGYLAAREGTKGRP